METSNMLGIAGIIATLLFGALSIDLFNKKRYPGRVFYIEQNIIGLIDSVVRNFDEISILHHNTQINTNLIYLKSSIINNGSIDINGNMIEKDISILLPDGAKWLKTKISATSPHLSCDFTIESDQEAFFDFGLFRKGEFIQFEALIEVTNDELKPSNLSEKIKLDHRIADTDEIIKRELISDKHLLKRKTSFKKNNLIMGGILLVFILGFILDIFDLRSAKTRYIQTDSNQQTHFYKASPQKNGFILLKDKKTGKEIEVTIQNFNESKEYSLQIIQETFAEKLSNQIWLILTYILVYFTMIFWDLYEIRKAYKLNDILRMTKKNSRYFLDTK